MASSINPLYIPSVLAKVLDYVTTVKDIENVRKVSKDFCAESLGQWRTTKRLILVGVPEGQPGILTRDFLQILKDSDSRKNENDHQVIRKPYRDYYIRNERSLCFPQTGNDLNNLFWEKLGEHMNTLELFSSCYLQPQNFPSGLKWLLFKACQNLKELHIKDPIIISSRSINEDTSNISMALGNGNFLRSTAPNLTVLSLTNFHRFLFSPNFEDNLEMGKNLFNMMPHLSSLKLDASTLILIEALPHSLQSTGKFIQLESLDLNLTYCVLGQALAPVSSLIEYMNVAKPPLKHLKLRLNFLKVQLDPMILRILFSVCANTLESLNLLFSFDFIPFCDINFSELVAIEFPHLTHLLLTIEECHKPFSNRSSFSFDFRSLLKMPSLQVFRCVEGLPTKHVKQLGNFVNLRRQVGDFVHLRCQLEELVEEISKNPLNHLEVFQYTLPHKFSFDDSNLLRKWMPAIKQVLIKNKRNSTLSFSFVPTILSDRFKL